MRKTRLRMVRLERQPQPPGDSWRAFVYQGERGAASGQRQMCAPRPLLQKQADGAIQRQRRHVGALW